MPDSEQVQLKELERQYQLLRHELPERLVMISLAYGLCMIWADPRVIGTIWLLHLVLETQIAHPRNARHILSSRWHYRAILAGITLSAGLFSLAAVLVWQAENPFSKAFSVILLMAGLMHLTTVRSLHLPFGLAGLAGVAPVVLVSNMVYWLDRGDYAALGLSTAACFVVLAYTLTSMLSTHNLHRSMAAGEMAARAAESAKGMFLSRMSHELRTPLNALIGMGQAELATATEEGAGMRMQRMQTLTDAARTLALILDDVSDLDAIGRGRLRLRPRVLPLPQELAAIAATHAERARRLGIPFSTSTEGDFPAFARLDPVRLRQCLGNLMANALRHAPQGAVHASCLCLQDPAGGSGALLQIDLRDGGPGIAEGQREAIFEAFNKGRSTAPGSGLGLAIARELARSMGGDLKLLPGKTGSTFRLTLRLEITGPPTAPDARPDLAGRTVLVVDDIATNRLVASGYLHQLGARVIGAASGAEALDILAGEEVDLVLLDMNMPGLDGFATTSRAREMGGRAAAVPIVAMTADVLDDQVSAIRHAGLDGYLPKPLLPEALAAELSRLLT